MNLIKNHLAGLIFWLLITIFISVILFIYFDTINRNLLILSFIPLLSFLGYMFGSLKSGELKLFPSNWFQYIIENLLFFSIFILTLFLLKQDFNFIKISSFIVMTAVGIFNTIHILKNTANR